MLIPAFRWHHSTDTSAVFQHTSLSTTGIPIHPDYIDWAVVGSSYAIDAKRRLVIPLSAFGTVDLFISLTVRNRAGQTAFVQAYLLNINSEWILLMPSYKIYFDGIGLVQPTLTYANSIKVEQGYWYEKVIRSNADVLSAVVTTNTLSTDFFYTSFILALSSSYTFIEAIDYTIGSNSAKIPMTMRAAIDTNYANINCLICKYIGLLNTRILLSDYAIDDCGDEMQLIKRLFRYLYLIQYSCDMTSNTLEEIKCFLEKECKQIELDCINCN
jgi:hypothetical protein